MDLSSSACQIWASKSLMQRRICVGVSQSVKDVVGFCIVEINENVEVRSNDQQTNFQLACDFFFHTARGLIIQGSVIIFNHM
jgi:hypothetical protein